MKAEQKNWETPAQWFAGGARLGYDVRKKTFIEANAAAPTATVEVFMRAEGAADTPVTFLSGFPDGTHGWARPYAYLPPADQMPKLFIEYVGQGDSDKPKGFDYSVSARADLVEAAWRARAVRETFVVCFDYSSLTLLDLLHRRLKTNNESAMPKITGVVLINGGLFAHKHSHPFLTTPLLSTPFGPMGTWFLQRSKFMFAMMMRVLWSPQYAPSKREKSELYDVVTRRKGGHFLSSAAGFVKEHKRRRKDWDFGKLFNKYKEEIPFFVIGSAQDPFEHKQIAHAQKTLSKAGLSAETLPGGHLITSEQPALLAAKIAAAFIARNTAQQD